MDVIIEKRGVSISCPSFSWSFQKLHWKPQSGSPKPHPSKPHPCSMPQLVTSENGSCAAVFGKLRCKNCTATFPFLQCRRHFDQKTALQQAKNCTATLKKLRCRKVALSCRFRADFRLPRLGTHVQDLLIKDARYLLALRALKKNLVNTQKHSKGPRNFAARKTPRKLGYSFFSTTGADVSGQSTGKNQYL